MVDGSDQGARDRRLRAIFAGSVDFAIIAFDLDGVVTDWNPGAERVFGWSADEMLGESAARFFTPEDRAAGRVETEMRCARDEGRASDERWHLRRDGSRFWASGEMIPLADEGGAHIGYLKIVRDRTAEHGAARALERSKDRYQALFEALSAGFCVIEMKFDRDGRPVDHLFIEANAAFEAQAGFADPIGKLMRDIIPEHEQHWFDFYGEVAKTRRPRTHEFGAAALGRWFEIHAFPIDAPELCRVAVLFNDLTARRRAEQALRDLNATLEQRVAERTAERDRLWRSSLDVLLVGDASGVVQSVNPAWTQLLGWEQEDLVGRTTEWLEHPDDLDRTRAEVGQIAAGVVTTRFENRLRGRDGSYRWLSWTAVLDDGHIFAIGRDVTAEKEQAEALARTEEQLRQSQKMEAVGQLTGGLAHDFNNLLTGITGSLELLGIRVAQGRYGDVERYVAAAQGAAKRAAALTHRLLAFSRRQTLDPKPTDVNRLIAGMEDLVRRTVGPEVAVEVVAAGGLWATRVDPNQLENALLNLCINARDAMPGGGRLTIETGNRWLDARAAKERDLEPGQYISLCVSDTGEGMTADVIAKAFDPFFTTKPIGVGTGLGLSMIYGFARQSGGQVRIDSEPGDGALVCLYLPRYFGEADCEQPDAATDAVAAGDGETVLVVDDEPTVRMLVTEVLEELGYAAIEAADGASGLKVLQSDARVDLLVTDIGLPGGMNGRQMADAARASRPSLKVLFITGYAENAVVGNGHLDRGMHVMTKPFSMDALAARIRELITG